MQVSSLLPPRVIRYRVFWLGLLLLFTIFVTFPSPFNLVIQVAESVVGIKLGRFQRPFVFGLDLQGGTHLEYEADIGKVPELDRREALNGVRDVIERRVNALGVSEPLVQTTRAGDAWRLTVELAGIPDVNEAIRLIGETPILEFKEQNDQTTTPITVEQKKEMDRGNAEAKKKAENLLMQSRMQGVDFVALAKANTENPTNKAHAGDVGFLYSHADYRDIFADAKGAVSGTVLGKVYDRVKYYAIAKVEAIRSNDKEIEARHILIGYKGAQETTSSTYTKEQAKAKAENLLKQATTANFVALAKEHSQEPGAAESGGNLGWAPASNYVPAFEKALKTQRVGTITGVIETEFGFHIIWKIAERLYHDPKVRVIEIKKTVESDIMQPADSWKSTKLTGRSLKSARVDFDKQTGAVQVLLQLNEDGTKRFAELTKRNVGKPLAIFLDGRLVMDPPPTVREEIIGGQAAISGYQLQEARVIARRLQAGALPVPIQLISQQTVGPTLGADSLQKSLKAGLVGFALVGLFMVILYRIPGIISIIALVLYATMLAAIFKLIPVTLTLAGIAGFILSLGIAVDANVLIYERLKEEWKEGKRLAIALEDAFKRAWPSIRDGHVTVLISCAVLYWFSSSVIRGFAMTLALGTTLSLFTAIVSCRSLLRLLVTMKFSETSGWLFLKPRNIK